MQPYPQSSHTTAQVTHDGKSSKVTGKKYRAAHPSLDVHDNHILCHNLRQLDLNSNIGMVYIQVYVNIMTRG